MNNIRVSFIQEDPKNKSNILSSAFSWVLYVNSTWKETTRNLTFSVDEGGFGLFGDGSCS